MKHLIAGLLFVGLAITATQPIAQPTPRNSGPPTKAAKTSDPNKVICQHADQETGSRITPHMLCGTRAEWAQRLEEDRNNTEHVQRVFLQTVGH